MKIKNKIIDVLHYEQLNLNESIHICDSIIKTINFDTFAFENEVIIERCIIDNFLIHSCWFKKGLVFKNNQLINFVDYQMGGHNQQPIYFEGNIFFGFVNFFDCQFKDLIKVKNNIFIKGSNLLGNKNEGFHNTFDNGIIEENNLGEIDLERLS
jgi:hypothetical protein